MGRSSRAVILGYQTVSAADCLEDAMHSWEVHKIARVDSCSLVTARLCAGKSGVGLVSTAASPIRRRNRAPKPKRRIKRQPKKPEAASDTLPESFLSAIHPIGGVRVGGGPGNSLAGRYVCIWPWCHRALQTMAMAMVEF